MIDDEAKNIVFVLTISCCLADYGVYMNYTGFTAICKILIRKKHVFAGSLYKRFKCGSTHLDQRIDG